MANRACILGLIIILCAATLMSGCTVSAEGADGLSVVATIFAPYDFARAVGGGDADVKMLIKPGVESHAYEPSPKDIIDIQGADVFIYIGGENDAWVDRVLRSVDTSGKQIVKLIDCVEPIEAEDDGHGHELDEHIWTSPVNAKRMVSAIAAAFEAADGASAAKYGERAAQYMGKLDALDDEFRELVAGANRKELVFGDRFPFIYFTSEYGLTAHAAFPSCANDTEPSAQVVAALIDRVKADSIPVIYIIEQSNGRVAGVIAKATGAEIQTLHSCHNVTKQELDDGATYLSLMQQNVEALKAGLY